VTTTYSYWIAGLLVAVLIGRRLRLRVQLSRAKHRSLAGHARLGRFVAGLLPYYEYDDAHYFRADDAPPPIEAQRRAAFQRLATLFAQRFALTVKESKKVQSEISDLQFTSRYRVPFQFSARVRQQLSSGSFASASHGAMITDLDGNQRYDLTGSYGANVFGYDFYKQCIEAGSARVRDLGPVLGALHPVTAYNVQRLREISGLDQISFHMSGTEAVMQAVRLARYHTRRRYLVRFCGSYHGWWGDVQPGVGNPQAAPDTLTLKDMDERSLRVLRSRRDIACVLINPLQALHPNASAPSDSALVDSARQPGLDRAAYTRWLKQVREVCSERGIVLIIDDVFMGFRLARGGAQEYFGVRADIVTYGKTVAGGLPIGVVCGRPELMQRFDEQRPADVCFARGTFNSHPYVMGAMYEFLQRLDSPPIQALYRDLDQLWNGRAAALNERLSAAGVNVRVANLSSVWTVWYPKPSCYNWMFQYYLCAHDLALSWVGTGRIIFSLNYTEADYSAVADRFVAAARQMQEDGWWWQASGQSNKSIRRRLLLEMYRARVHRASDQSARPAADGVALGNKA
jgi:glutamate-1-semialdehyde 2,1-aminomutase